MGKFRFQAYDGSGGLLEGEIESDTEEKARDLVRARGATPFSIRPAGPSHVLLRDVGFLTRKKKVNDVKLAALTRDLAVLLQAGVPLEAALRIAANASADKAARDLTRRLLEGVLSGAMLADAMAAAKEFAQQEYVKIVQAGELGGDLGGALKELADLLDRRIEIRTRIRAALTYPALLVGLAVISMTIILGLLIPAITPIFLDNGQPLPPIIAVLDGVRAHWAGIVAIGGGGTLALVLGLVIARRNPGYRARIDRLYLSLPLLGPISQMREAARFCRTLATLMRAGVPLLQALGATSPLVKNQFMRDALERATADVSEGASLAGAIGKTAAMPSIAVQMIAVGEESGKLHDMLQRAATILERQEQDRTARVLAILSPVVTIGVAGMVAAIILSVVSGILAINDLVLR